jgi:hypothetical protein
MQILNMALSLVVTMLIFSTLATMVMEIIYKVLRLRQIGLKRMLDLFRRSILV